MKWHFSILFGNDFGKDLIDINFLTFHWERDFVFWIEILGIVFHWEKY